MAGRYYDTRVKTAKQFEFVAYYIEHNPVAKGLAELGENCFPTLLEAVEVCSLGQITGRLQEVVGRFRPMV